MVAGTLTTNKYKHQCWLHRRPQVFERRPSVLGRVIVGYVAVHESASGRF
jgi:hypothetical protein